MASRLFALGLLLLCGGAAMVLLGYFEYRRESRIRRWPSAPGRVLSAAIVRTTVARARRGPRERAPQPETTYREAPVWLLEGEYEYVVNGQRYVGDRLTYPLRPDELKNHPDGPGEALRAIEADLKKPGSREIRYNPDDPSDSYAVFVPAPILRGPVGLGSAAATIGLILSMLSRMRAVH